MKKGQKMDRTPHCITVWGMFGTSLCQSPITDKPHDPRKAAFGSITPKQIKYQKRICEKCLAILKGESQ